MSDPVKVRTDLKEILARSEFQTADNGENNPLREAIKFLQREWDTFVEWFKKLFDFASQYGTLGQTVVYIIVGLILVGAAWLLAKILRQYFQNRALNSVSEHTVFDIDEPEDQISHDSNVWLTDAEGMANQNDYRRAYRAVFVALLMHFEAAEILAFERGRTNGEYYNAVRTKTPKAASDSFRHFVLGFDHRWYGSEPTTESDYRQALKFYADIEQALAPKPQTSNAAPVAEGA